MKNQFEYRVYRNLHKENFSVTQKGLVIQRGEDFVLTKVQFQVRPKGREKVIATGHKNVHAFMCTNEPIHDHRHSDFYRLIEHLKTSKDYLQISYDPRKSPNFVLKVSSNPIDNIDINPEWVFDEVFAIKNKVYVNTVRAYKTLKNMVSLWMQVVSFLKTMINY